jgi:hypothetical protein
VPSGGPTHARLVGPAPLVARQHDGAVRGAVVGAVARDDLVAARVEAGDLERVLVGLRCACGHGLRLGAGGRRYKSARLRIRVGVGMPRAGMMQALDSAERVGDCAEPPAGATAARTAAESEEELVQITRRSLGQQRAQLSARLGGHAGPGVAQLGSLLLDGRHDLGVLVADVAVRALSRIVSAVDRLRWSRPLRLHAAMRNRASRAASRQQAIQWPACAARERRRGVDAHLHMSWLLKSVYRLPFASQK